jgi:hypothetical protein
MSTLDLSMKAMVVKCVFDWAGFSRNVGLSEALYFRDQGRLRDGI